jgi:hypothetical protein
MEGVYFPREIWSIILAYRREAMLDDYHKNLPGAIDRYSTRMFAVHLQLENKVSKWEDSYLASKQEWADKYIKRVAYDPLYGVHPEYPASIFRGPHGKTWTYAWKMDGKIW